MKKKILSVFLTLVLVLIFSLVTAVPASAAGTPTIDGVLDEGEWGAPLCVKSAFDESVTVYAIATTETLFMAFDSTDNLDERAVVDTESGANDVLDWNVGLVGSDTPWRYTLHTKAQSDDSWGGQFSEIDNDGTGRVYRGTWGVLGRDPHYSSIPAGIEMVTSFDAGNRVTEVKVPMSLMFDGQHGWDGPNAGDVLLLAGTNQVKPDGWPGEWAWDHGHLFWPDGWDSGNADTFAEVAIPGAAATATTEVVEDIIQISIDPTSFNFGSLRQGECSVPQELTITSGSNMDIVVSTSTESLFYTQSLNIGVGEEWSLVNEWSADIAKGGSLLANLKVCVPDPWDAGIQTGTIIFWAEDATP